MREGDRGGEAATAVLGRQRSKMAEAEDLFFQATTRGGRAVDGILAEKASTKTATTTAGVAAMTAGIGMTQGAQSSRDSRSSGAGYSATERAIGAAGGIVTLVGLLAVAASSGMDASADTRTWDTLPHSLYLAALVKPADFEPKSFDLQDNSGRSMLAARDAVRFNLRQGCSMAWVGSGNILLPTVAEPSPPVLPETGKPNCRTSAGTHRVLPSDVCLRIGGTVAE